MVITHKHLTPAAAIRHKGDSQLIYPTTANWRRLDTPISKDEFEVATGRYYIDVSKQ
jgi:hypothetical protein